MNGESQSNRSCRNKQKLMVRKYGSGNLRALDSGCRGDWVTLQSNSVMAWGVFKLVCVALHCHSEARLMLNCCKVKLVRNASRVLSASRCRYQSCLPSQQCINKNHSFTVPKGSDVNLVCWWRLLELFLLGRLRMVPLHGLPFSLWFKMMDTSFIYFNNPE